MSTGRRPKVERDPIGPALFDQTSGVWGEKKSQTGVSSPNGDLMNTGEFCVFQGTTVEGLSSHLRNESIGTPLEICGDSYAQ